MPFIIDNKIYPVVWHGGMKDLSKIDKITIELTITFPHEGTAPNMRLTDVTLNLVSDLEVTSTNQVYAVIWGDNRPETDTVSRSDIPAKHVHTYIGGTGQSSFEKTFNVEVYGYNLTKYYPVTKTVGNLEAGTGYKFTAREVSLLVRSKGF